jgi:hypothetical protein
MASVIYSGWIMVNSSVHINLLNTAMHLSDNKVHLYHGMPKAQKRYKRYSHL